MLATDGSRALPRRFLEGALAEMVDRAGDAAGDTQEQFLSVGIEDVLVSILWARTLWQDLFCAVVHGDWAGACTFGQEVEGLEAAAPDLHQERAALLNL